jgi:mycoredoxin
MENKIILYGSPICPMVGPVRALLNRAKVDFEYIDIYRDATAREKVRAINQGYESVPTLVFPDGSSLTEPSRSRLRSKLEALGYEVPLPYWRQLLTRFLNKFRR